jgi:hypothetical protein
MVGDGSQVKNIKLSIEEIFDYIYSGMDFRNSPHLVLFGLVILVMSS